MHVCLLLFESWRGVMYIKKFPHKTRWERNVNSSGGMINVRSVHTNTETGVIYYALVVGLCSLEEELFTRRWVLSLRGCKRDKWRFIKRIFEKRWDRPLWKRISSTILMRITILTNFIMALGPLLLLLSPYQKTPQKLWNFIFVKLLSC